MFVAGSMAGVTAVMATYPLDLVRARLAYITTTGAEVGQQRFKIVRTLVDVVKLEGGIKGLYKGLTPTIVAMIPHAGKLNTKQFWRKFFNYLIIINHT